MDDREARKATNESLFREVNERIEHAAENFAFPDRVEFVCECGDVACTDRLLLSLAEYEEIRAHPARFAIKPGHDDPEVDRVVDDGGEYAVVEKIGEAREVARRQDPRS
jgi:hypothetical protein